ncbi:hypothetical protein EPI10_029852 [Gossypium australe]|uniref:Uncharacterized protein n=1 Tax=Gossypium australe TaxID=47621 RepID=A0A5B6WYS5_9ROSI|nr:hypothetical protein EPI10_029852 [Gossypium australe]
MGERGAKFARVPFQKLKGERLSMLHVMSTKHHKGENTQMLYFKENEWDSHIFSPICGSTCSHLYSRLFLVRLASSVSTTMVRMAESQLLENCIGSINATRQLMQWEMMTKFAKVPFQKLKGNDQACYVSC